jgi:hypothetical protein
VININLLSTSLLSIYTLLSSVSDLAEQVTLGQTITYKLLLFTFLLFTKWWIGRKEEG